MKGRLLMQRSGKSVAIDARRKRTELRSFKSQIKHMHLMCCCGCIRTKAHTITHKYTQIHISTRSTYGIEQGVQLFHTTLKFVQVLLVLWRHRHTSVWWQCCHGKKNLNRAIAWIVYMRYCVSVKANKRGKTHIKLELNKKIDLQKIKTKKLWLIKTK